MSKREGEIPEDAPEAKKAKIEETPAGSGTGGNVQRREGATNRPGSPIAGPSSAPSDPQLQVTGVGLIPAYRYYDPRFLDESSSQGSVSIITGISSTTTASTTTGETTSSVQADADSSVSMEGMDVDSELETSETSDATESQHRRYPKHMSRRDHK